MKDRYVSKIDSQIAYGQQAASQYLGSYSSNIDPKNPGTGCSLDGQKVQCNQLFKALNRDSVGSVSISTTGGAGGVGGESGVIIGVLANAGASIAANKRQACTNSCVLGPDGEPVTPGEIYPTNAFLGMMTGFGQAGGQQEGGAKQTAAKPDPLLITDDSGRHCRPSEISSIYMKNRSANLYEIIPHTWLQVPSGSWGFGPNGTYREGPGGVHDNSDPVRYHSDVTVRYAACPESVAVIEQAIKDNQDGLYVYSNRPKAVEKIGLHLWAQNGDLFEIYKYYLPAGYNCTGWACKMLEIAGFKPPVPSSKPNIGPGYVKR